MPIGHCRLIVSVLEAAARFELANNGFAELYPVAVTS